MNEEIGHGACLYMVAEFQHIAFCPRPHETSIFFSNYNGFPLFLCWSTGLVQELLQICFFTSHQWYKEIVLFC